MWTITNNKEWEALKKFQWVSDMHGVPQSPVHHAEGDVAVHTQMVLNTLPTIEEFNNLDEQSREIIWAAALLHDVEKRSTTVIDDRGEITSPGHSRKGAMTARGILYREIPAPFAVREEICGLIKHHGLPVWIFEKRDTTKALLKASLECNTQWLYILAKADMLGRICRDKNEMLYRVEMFRELCIEHNCWGIPVSFGSALARFTYFTKEGKSPDYIPYNTNDFEITLMSGIAGSGKDHYIQKHLRSVPVISLDEMRRKYKIDRNDSKGNGRVIQEATEQAKAFLRNKTSFVWNATNISQQMREQLITSFSVYNPSIRMIYMEVPYKTLISQNAGREYCIPSAAIERMIDRLEVPKLWEVHHVDYHSQ